MRSMTDKTITLLKAWGLHPKGATLTLNSPVADLLIQRGAAEEKAKPIKPARKSK